MKCQCQSPTTLHSDPRPAPWSTAPTPPSGWTGAAQLLGVCQSLGPVPQGGHWPAKEPASGKVVPCHCSGGPHSEWRLTGNLRLKSGTTRFAEPMIGCSGIRCTLRQPDVRLGVRVAPVLRTSSPASTPDCSRTPHMPVTPVRGAHAAGATPTPEQLEAEPEATRTPSRRRGGEKGHRHLQASLCQADSRFTCAVCKLPYDPQAHGRWLDDDHTVLRMLLADLGPWVTDPESLTT